MDLSDSWAVSQPTATRMSAAEAVFADIRDAIVSGRIAVGERLPATASVDPSSARPYARAPPSA